MSQDACLTRKLVYKYCYQKWLQLGDDERVEEKNGTTTFYMDEFMIFYYCADFWRNSPQKKNLKRTYWNNVSPMMRCDYTFLNQ